jgi:protein tyrosine phosphatase
MLVEETRVQLAGAGKDTYINANYVHSPLGIDRKMIAAQGPKDNTVGHF